jgi:hypothetical protein
MDQFYRDDNFVTPWRHDIPIRSSKIPTQRQKAGFGDQVDMQVRSIPGITNEIGLKDEMLP